MAGEKVYLDAEAIEKLILERVEAHTRTLESRVYIFAAAALCASLLASFFMFKSLLSKIKATKRETGDADKMARAVEGRRNSSQHGSANSSRRRMSQESAISSSKPSSDREEGSGNKTQLRHLKSLLRDSKQQGFNSEEEESDASHALSPMAAEVGERGEVRESTSRRQKSSEREKDTPTDRKANFNSSEPILLPRRSTAQSSQNRSSSSIQPSSAPVSSQLNKTGSGTSISSSDMGPVAPRTQRRSEGPTGGKESKSPQSPSIVWSGGGGG
eukprot:CAMPEP_0179493028 /NCGR_PEP_ID=MMETSP0799-20121207/67172_1 /TAXON_ID=46947 /ORGANISM="Geminigera cryophila, Strain CCMP2564" /LENGTH=271 /DNA_ID=CAMNT_0021310057 /DNA_START=157 /DNA_END=968 /DNA_ORIENTATION=+